jgi:hypothetical protein
LIERLRGRRGGIALDRVELMTDFQLQVEHALDLQGRECVIFIDAGMAVSEPFSLSPVAVERDASYTTHAVSPGAILRVFQKITSLDPPPTWLLAIRGYAFDLGSPLTPQAERNLALAERYLVEKLLPESRLAG